MNKIEELDISVRTWSCLKRAGINYLENLTNMTEEDLMKVRNIGRRSMEELKQVLKNKNLSFREEE